MSATASKTPSPGVIRADECYSIKEFARRTGLGSWARREMRRNGFRPIVIGRVAFVRGVDFIAYLDRLAVDGGDK